MSIEYMKMYINEGNVHTTTYYPVEAVTGVVHPAEGPLVPYKVTVTKREDDIWYRIRLLENIDGPLWDDQKFEVVETYQKLGSGRSHRRAKRLLRRTINMRGVL